MCGGCPFDFCSEETEIIQNWGCLPTAHEIIQMRQNHQKTWACHSDITKPCVGAIAHMKQEGLQHRIVDKQLVDERHDWSLYCTEIAS
jgi:hypothetical protein